MRDRYAGLMWLEILGSDEKSGVRKVTGYENHSVRDLVVSLGGVYGVRCEIEPEGMLWRLRCLPPVEKRLEGVVNFAVSYLANDIGGALRAALMDYDEVARGNGYAIYSNRPVDREVEC